MALVCANGARFTRCTPSERAKAAGAPVEVDVSRMEPGELKIIETRVYRGPNYWNYDPAIKLIVDLGILEQFPTNTIPGFVTTPPLVSTAPPPQM